MAKDGLHRLNIAGCRQRTPPARWREGGLKALHDLREAIANPARFEDADIELRFSVGLWCGVPNPQDSTACLIAQADAALYQAKASGRNAVRMATRLGLVYASIKRPAGWPGSPRW